MILFDEAKHIYYDSETLEIFDSVSRVIGTYKNKFDAKPISEKYVEDHKLDISAEQLREQWKDINRVAIHRGKRHHFTEELLSFIFEASGLSRDYNDTIDLANLKDGVYPELRIYNRELYLCGTADKVTISTGDDGKRYCIIDDYKTNIKPMQMRGFRDQVMLFPLNQIQDCNYYHYTLQLNIYAYMLSCFGYIPLSLTLIHKRFMDDEEIPEKYKIPFVTEEKLREPINYSLKINLEFTEKFLKYDFETRNKQGRNLYRIS